MPPRHPVFRSGIVAPVTEDFFEWPIRVYECSVGAPTQTSPATSASGNESHTFDIASLFVLIDPLDPNLGTIPAPFWKEGASLLVVAVGRGKNPSLRLIEDFCDYAKNYVPHFLSEASGNPQERVREARQYVRSNHQLARNVVKMMEDGALASFSQ